ncbi:hypothetical protein ABIB94_007361 [Bradyrhizobium sp. JR7.2]|nr:MULTISPECIES: hypothetical protein [Bradyrhizobium]UFW91771.1 hypothetical protein BjapCC829_45835 [Bradyrhizobium japonicum]WFU00295.1 hypothetical protein QA633_46585 [Bradyrhizobium barranii]
MQMTVSRKLRLALDVRLPAGLDHIVLEAIEQGFALQGLFGVPAHEADRVWTDPPDHMLVQLDQRLSLALQLGEAANQPRSIAYFNPAPNSRPLPSSPIMNSALIRSM